MPYLPFVLRLAMEASAGPHCMRIDSPLHGPAILLVKRYVNGRLFCVAFFPKLAARDVNIDLYLSRIMRLRVGLKPTQRT